MAELFDVEVNTINYHLKEIYQSGELQKGATIRNFRIVQNEGGRTVTREVEYYHLDAIIAVGYRVNSLRATQFRIWATQTLPEFIIKGFVLDDERLKLNKRFGPDYFDELLERIREIRASERRFNLKITDIYEQCSIDYSPNAEIPKVNVVAGQVGVTKGGVIATPMSVAEEKFTYGSHLVPDVLAYLQNETELTRSTLVRNLKESGRLNEFFNDPQRFMDAVARVIKYELHRLLVDGIKYEKIPGTGPEAVWEMMLFKVEELVNYLNALQVNKSVYEYVVYDSDVEREFARRLDLREDIKLFVKLPGWFQIDTPVGKYNPDWAVVKEGDQTLYLVRETKGTRDFLQLRNSEADKVRCGKKHFEALDVPFAVVVSADEV